MFLCSVDDDQCISGRTSYDICGRQCTCVGGQVVDCCRVRVDFAGMSSEDKNRFISAIIQVATDQFKPRYDDLLLSTNPPLILMPRAPNHQQANSCHGTDTL